MLAPQCLAVMAVLGAAPLLLAFPADPQTWIVHHSGQVARPVLVNSSPVSDEFPIPRFVMPSASRRQDGPASGPNNLQNESPVHVKPGDTVSLIVRGRNPLEPQQFVDVGSLLMELQKVPPASDGSYHVFLAPPDYPQPVGGQKFDVTYVGAPQVREPQQHKDPRNPHPPLFVAPLDYSVPQGYGRVQIPTRNVKFAINGAPPPFQQQVQQPAQFQQQFQPAQQQFRPQPAPQPQQFQPNQQPQQFQAPQQQQQHQQVQFLPPQPVQFLPAPQPQFQPILPQRFQPIQPQQVQPRPQFSQPPPPPPPSSFEQSLSDVRIQTGFVPVQTLEEAAPPPPPPPAPKEPLVLAVESPEFLQLTNEPVSPVVIPEAPQTTPQPVIIAKLEEKVVPVQQVEVKLPATTVQPAPAVPVTLAPVPEEVNTAAPTPAFEQVIPAATPIPAPVIPENSETTTLRSNKKRPSIRIPVEGGSPQWPDFQSVRQRQQLQRQQNNRKKPTFSSSNSFNNPAIQDEESDIPLEPSFGQKIRKIKTNALVSPPIPAEPKVSVELPQPQSLQGAQPFDIDPPVLDRDEPFQTLESQNAASGNQRGRIRFNRPSEGSANVIPSEAVTVPPVRQTVSTLVGGRNRVRIFTTTQAPTTTAAPTAPPTSAPTSAPVSEAAFEEEPVPEEPVPEEPALGEEIIRGDAPLIDNNDPVEEEEPVAEEEEILAGDDEEVVVPDEKSAEPAEKPWSPYEAIQRQRETTVEPEAASQVISNSGQPIRIRGKTTFSSSRIPIEQVLPDVGNRQVLLRPAASIRRPSPQQPIRISKPALEIPEVQNVRLQDDLLPPAAPGFGIRGTVEPKPELINNPAPPQFLLPIGRRVPEVRPGFQTIRIGRPTTTEAPVEVVDDLIVEEDPADVPQEEVNEFVTDDPTLVNEQEPEEGEDEILTDEVEGEENEEFVDEVVADQMDATTSTPLMAGSVDNTTESVTDFVEEQDSEAGQDVVEAGQDVIEAVQDVVETIQDVVESTTKLPKEESVTTTTESSVIESQQPESQDEEGVVELAAGNQVDDQSNKQNVEDERQVLGVSTATEVSLMYELCYRGRCVRVHE